MLHPTKHTCTYIAYETRKRAHVHGHMLPLTPQKHAYTRIEGHAGVAQSHEKHAYTQGKQATAGKHKHAGRKTSPR